MTTRQRTHTVLPPQPAAATPAPLGHEHEDVSAMLLAIEATGASRLEALAWTAERYGPKAVQSYWESWARINADTPAAVIRSLGELAVASPEAAQVWFNRWGEDRQVDHLHAEGCAWITTLPHGLSANKHLWLDRSGITSLPDGLTLGGNLDLSQTPIVALPEGLDVGGYLFLVGCPAWDGRIPENVRLCKGLMTNRYPDGLTLKDWREFHPDGEPPWEAP